MRWSRSSTFAIPCVTLVLVGATAMDGLAQEGAAQDGAVQDGAAQDDRPAETSDERTRDDAAREAFVSGAEAAERQLWADSERHFARAYELSRVPAALFNRAVALRNLGREREARDAFDRISREEVDDATRTRAITLRDEAAARVVTLVVVGLDPGVSHEVEVDGELRLDTGARPLRLEVDPGARGVEIARAERERFRWRGVVAPGEELVVRASLPERSVRRSRGWIAAVAGAIVVGAVVGVAVGVSRRDGPTAVQPMSDLVLRVD
jgi:hypothetical protein